MYQVLINGLDRTKDVIARSIVITDVINDQVNTCDFEFIDHTGQGMISNGQEIIIDLASGTRIFGGYVLSHNMNQRKFGTISAKVKCIDYTRDLDRNLAHTSYSSSTDKEIIEDLVSRYCPGLGITTTNVIEGVTIDNLIFNYVQLSQAFRKIADLTARNWYIDYNKDIHYFPLTQSATPFNITSAAADYSNLEIKKDISQLKNRIYIKGGTKLSDFVTFSEKGDGEKRIFILPDKPHDVSVEVNGVSKTVGIKHINTSGFDYYINFEEKYIEQDSGASVLTTSDVLEVTYKYDIPILVAQEDTDSIEEFGVSEFSIFDKTIETTEAARERAIAELTDYANNLIEGSFQTYTNGFRSGQYININHSGYDVNDDYIVQRVQMRALGSGKFVYTISLASAKTMGIIRFLIELLEANRNLIELDPNEVVDELLQISDNLIGDSLTDLVTDSVTTPPFQWKADNGSGGNMRWDLFEWG